MTRSLLNLECIMREELQKLSFYHLSHLVHVTILPPSGWALTYTDGTLGFGKGTRLDLNLYGESFVGAITLISLHPSLRGGGLGNEFYDVAEKILFRADCSEVITSASGTTPTGESRVDYLIRKRGYELTMPNGIEVRKRLG